MIDYDDEDDDIDYDEIDYGETQSQPQTKQKQAPSASSSRFRNRFSISDTPSPVPPKPSTPQPTGGVFGFLNHTSASAPSTPKKDVFDFSNTRAPTPTRSSFSTPASPATPTKRVINSALYKADKYLNPSKPVPQNKILTKATISSNADFTISDDDEDLVIDASETKPPPSSSFSSSKKSENFTMSDDEDLEIDAESEEEGRVPVKSASPLKAFNLKTVDDLLGSIPPLLPLTLFGIHLTTTHHSSLTTHCPSLITTYPPLITRHPLPTHPLHLFAPALISSSKKTERVFLLHMISFEYW